MSEGVHKQPITIFPPCLVDQVYPEMGESLVALLQALDFEVTLRDNASCCGQPAFNSGYAEQARAVGRAFCDAHRKDGEVLCPSGSCASMVRVWYPELLGQAPRFRMFELAEFIHERKLGERIGGKFPGKIAFHASCHTLRELRLTFSLRELFPRIEGFEECCLAPVCCGFGGIFCARFPELARNIGASRIELAEAQGVEVLVSNDPGCIMQLRTQARERGSNIKILHIAEFAVKAMGLVV